MRLPGLLGGLAWLAFHRKTETCPLSVFVHDVIDEDFLNLADGECLIGATRSTSGERVFRVRIRPTVTNAGGETLQAE